MSNSDIEQAGTVKGHIPNGASLSGRISNVVSLSGHISIGSGSSDFIIKMTVEVNGDNYIVTSCDKTMEQIDAAVASGQNIKAIAFDKFIMPMTQIMEYGESYTFGAFLGAFLVMADVAKNTESGTDDWQFYLIPLAADIVEYSNDAMPRISTVSEALDKIVPNSHTHANKAVLDKFAETDGKPTYNGEAIGGDITAEDVSYHDSFELGFENVGQTLDALVAGVDATRKDVLRLNKSEHTHSNKSVLDKFAESDGKPTYGGQALGGGASDFIIKMTVAIDDDGNYTVTSCDATFEQVDAAVAAEKRVVIIATETTNNIVFELPIAQAYQGLAYYFGTFIYGRKIFSAIYKEEENETWEFSITDIEASDVTYSNNSLPYIYDVSDALDKLITKKINSAFEYIHLFDNEEYRLTDVTKLRIAYPTSDFECWIRLSFAASGDITVTLPTGAKYIGVAPDFKNGETWELSIKDGIVIAQKVGDGT